MTTNPQKRSKRERPSTYVVQDTTNEEEKRRITIQDQMITAGMNGVLSEQEEPEAFHRILDVACGTGGWLIEAAKAYETMIELVGIDISSSMIAAARERAQTEQVADRVTFHTMDTLRMLEFPNEHFDLVNLRFGVSFLRTWDWAKLLAEFQRITKYKGIIRITECDTVECNSKALTNLISILMDAYYKAGHYFRSTYDGLTSELVPLMIQHGLDYIQTTEHTLNYKAGTPEGQYFAEDMAHSFRTVRPFMQKWTKVPTNYDELYQRALEEMQYTGFEARWKFVTVWGTRTANN